MVLNLRLYTYNFYIFILVFTSLLIFSPKITLTTHLYDIISNIYISDYYYNNFYFISTQFFILPSLFLFLTCIHHYSFIKNKSFSKTVFLITLPTLLITWWIFEYYTLNQYQYLVCNSQYFFNNLLINPLNKYHPLLFFSTYIYLVSLTFFLNPFYYSRNIEYLGSLGYSIICLTFTKTNFYWLVISFSLYLGSWWALQEGSWGGWWNWDASEVFGLLILTVLLLYMHLNVRANTPLTIQMSLTYYIVLILFTYFILQMSYSIVSHNFGLSLVGYGYTQIIFLNLITTLVLVFLLLTRKLYNFFTYVIHNSSSGITRNNSIINGNGKNFIKNSTFTSKNTYILSAVLTYLTLQLYITSFNPIFSNVFWTSFSVEILNQILSNLNIKLLLLLLVTLLFTKINTILTLNNFTQFYIFSNIIIFYPFYVFRQISSTNYFHLLIYTTCLISIYLNYSVYVQWNYATVSTCFTDNTYVRSIWHNNIFTENVYIFDSLTSLSSHKLTNCNSFFSFMHNIDTQFFKLDLTDDSLKQVIHNHTYLYLFSVSVNDKPSLITDLLTSPVVVVIVYIFLRKLKIIF